MIEAKVLKNSISSARRTRTVREVNENQTHGNGTAASAGNVVGLRTFKLTMY